MTLLMFTFHLNFSLNIISFVSLFIFSVCYVRYEIYLESGGGKKGKEKRKKNIENKDVSVVFRIYMKPFLLDCLMLYCVMLSYILL